MGLRFRKSIKLLPGVKLNLGGKSVGLSVGGKYGGVSVNSRTGARRRFSLPGTGLSYTSKIAEPHKSTVAKDKPYQATASVPQSSLVLQHIPFHRRWWAIAFAVIAICAAIALFNGGSAAPFVTATPIAVFKGRACGRTSVGRNFLFCRHLAVSALPFDFGYAPMYSSTQDPVTLNVADAMTYYILPPSLPYEQYLVTAAGDAINIYLKIPGISAQAVKERSGTVSCWPEVITYLQGVDTALNECVDQIGANVHTRVIALNDAVTDAVVIYMIVDGLTFFDATTADIGPDILPGNSADTGSDLLSLGALTAEQYADFSVAEACGQAGAVSLIGSFDSDKYHRPCCHMVKKISQENMVYFSSSAAGYSPCSICNP